MMATHVRPANALSDAEPPRCLFVKGLAKGVSERHLGVFFGTFGSVQHCQLARHRSGRSAGFAIVTFNHHQQAELALHETDNAIFLGRKLSVRWFQPDRDGLDVEVGNFFPEGLSYAAYVAAHTYPSVPDVILTGPAGTSACTRAIAGRHAVSDPGAFYYDIGAQTSQQLLNTAATSNGFLAVPAPLCTSISQPERSFVGQVAGSGTHCSWSSTIDSWLADEHAPDSTLPSLPCNNMPPLQSTPRRLSADGATPTRSARARRASGSFASIVHGMEPSVHADALPSESAAYDSNSLPHEASWTTSATSLGNLAESRLTTKWGVQLQSSHSTRATDETGCSDNDDIVVLSDLTRVATKHIGTVGDHSAQKTGHPGAVPCQMSNDQDLDVRRHHQTQVNSCDQVYMSRHQPPPPAPRLHHRQTLDSTGPPCSWNRNTPCALRNACALNLKPFGVMAKPPPHTAGIHHRTPQQLTSTSSHALPPPVLLRHGSAPLPGCNDGAFSQLGIHTMPAHQQLALAQMVAAQQQMVAAASLFAAPTARPSGHGMDVYSMASSGDGIYPAAALPQLAAMMRNVAHLY